MAPKRYHHGDPRNVPFDIGESPLEDTKSGFDDRGHDEGETSDDSDQYPRRAKKGEVPREPLARRIRSHQ
jgi:hypothetical protein